MAAKIVIMKKVPNPVDIYVGSRVRMRRLMLGMTQEALADRLRISFQQVQKYEKGTNRVSASRLVAMAQILQVPVPFFFEGAPESAGVVRGAAKAPSFSYVSDFLISADGHALMRAFARIKDSALLRSIVRLVEQLVGERSDG